MGLWLVSFHVVIDLMILISDPPAQQIFPRFYTAAFIWAAKMYLNLALCLVGEKGGEGLRRATIPICAGYIVN